MLKKTIYAGLFLILFTVTVNAEDYSDVTEKSFEIQGRPDLVLRNTDGEIHVTAREGSTVEIKITRKVHGAKNLDHAKKEVERISLDIEQVGSEIRATTIWPNSSFNIGWSNRPRVHVRYEIFTPAESNLRAEVSDGQLRVTGLTGRLELNTSDGTIDGTGLSGDIDVHGSDGDIHLKQSSGNLKIRLSDGDLLAENCSGRVTVRSGDGRIELPGFDGEAEISNGDGDVLVDGVLKSMTGKIVDGEMVIRVAPGSVMQTDWWLSASDGEILLDLPDGFSAELEVTTGDGHVETDHPISLKGRLSSRRLQGTIREGGHLLQIKTSDGNVAIK